MQNSQQTFEILRNDQYQMYEVIVPRTYWNQEQEDKVKWANDDTFFNTGRALIGCAQDGYYQEPLWITAINNTYSIHPGSSRYILNRVSSTMPPLKAIVVDRYGTSQQMISDTFECDATSHRDNFVGYWRHKHNPAKQNDGHMFKPYRTTNKSQFDIDCTVDDTYIMGSKYTVRFTNNGRHLIDFGLGNNQLVEVEVQSTTEFGRALLTYFEDII